jgi:argininosuccinate synthase
VDTTQENMTGDIKIELYKGNINILSRSSIFSLYNMKLATYTDEDTFDHKASEGFIKLFGLPHKTMSEIKMNLKEEGVA